VNHGKAHYVVWALLILLLANIPSHLFANNELWQQPLTIQQAIEYALEHNPDLLISREKLLSSEYAQHNSMLNKHPSISANAQLDANRSNSSDDSLKPGIGLSISLPVYYGGKLSIDREIADYQYQISLNQLERKKQKLLKDIKNAYIDVVHANLQWQEDKETLKRLKEHARITKVFYQEAQVWRNDVLQAEVRIAQGEKQLISSFNQILLHKSLLNQLLGRAIDGELNIQSRIQWYDFTMPTGSLNQLIKVRHPDFMVSKLEYEIAKLKVASSQAEKEPRLDLSFGVNANKELLQTHNYAQSMSLGMDISYQLWDGGRLNNSIAIAQSNYTQAEHQLFVKKQQLSLAINNALLAVSEAKKQLNVLNKALQSAEENYRVNTLRYQEQMSTASDLLDAQDLLSTSKKDALGALANYLKAIESLHYEMGNEKNEVSLGLANMESDLENQLVENKHVENKIVEQTIINVLKSKQLKQSQPVKRLITPTQNIQNEMTQLKGEDYSIQLIGLSNKNSFNKIRSEHKDIKNLYWLESQRNQKPWFVLIYGSFNNKKLAQKAFHELPDSLKFTKPWVRRNQDIKQSIMIN